MKVQKNVRICAAIYYTKAACGTCNKIMKKPSKLRMFSPSQSRKATGVQAAHAVSAWHAGRDRLQRQS